MIIILKVRELLLFLATTLVPAKLTNTVDAGDKRVN